MRADEDEDEVAEPEFECFRLTLTIAGPNHRDKIVLEAQDVAELDPTYRDQNGLTYERYAGDRQQATDLRDGAQEYIEVRFDYVVSRELQIIYKTPHPEPAPAADLDDEAAELARPAEERVVREEPS